MVLPEMTSPEVTLPEPEVTLSEVCACATGCALFAYYTSSTKCTIAHDRKYHGHRWMCRHQASRDPERGSLGRVGCVHAQQEVAQYPPYW